MIMSAFIGDFEFPALLCPDPPRCFEVRGGYQVDGLESAWDQSRYGSQVLGNKREIEPRFQHLIEL